MIPRRNDRRSTLALALSAAVVWIAPGLGCYEALGQVVEAPGGLADPGGIAGASGASTGRIDVAGPANQLGLTPGPALHGAAGGVRIRPSLAPTVPAPLAFRPSAASSGAQGPGASAAVPASASAVSARRANSASAAEARATGVAPEVSRETRAAPGDSAAVNAGAELGRIQENLTPVLRSAVRPEASAPEAAGAARGAFGILVRRPEADLGAASLEPPGVSRPGPGAVESPSSGGIDARLEASRPHGTKSEAETPPAATEGPKLSNPQAGWRRQALSYAIRRRILASIASIWGISLSMPRAGAGLEARVLSTLASKKIAFLDYDDTLGPHNSTLAPDMVAALVAARRAGKEIAIVTDRPDVKREGSATLTVFESLATIPAADRAGILVSANNGGRIYWYNAQGEPEKLYEAPPFTEAEVAANRKANEAAKAKLASIGVSLYPGDKAIGTESYNPYGYALMLQVGTPEAKVKEAGALLQRELDALGSRFTVQPRIAKDPTKPPYLTYSKLDKSVPVDYVTKLMGVAPGDAFAAGDSVYNPAQKRLKGLLKWTAPAAKRFGEWISGRPMPQTGNDTDSNMERGLPGMLMLSVGGSAYAAIRNSYVLSGRGPATTKRVLEAFADGSGVDAPKGIALSPAATTGSDASAATEARRGRILVWGTALGAVGLYGLAQLAPSIVGIPAFVVWGGAFWAAMPFSLILFLLSTEKNARGDNIVVRPKFDLAAELLMTATLGAGLIGAGADLLGRFIPGALSLGMLGVAGIARRGRKSKEDPSETKAPTAAAAADAAAVPGKLSDDEVLASAKAMGAYKGYPWSQTEYNASVYYAEDSLRRRGATEAQLERFRKTCAALPVRGGRFNPWSGD